MKDQTVLTINSDSIDNVTEKVETAITVLAEKIGVASDHFYPIMVKQYGIEGAIGTGWSVFTFLLFLFFAAIGTTQILKSKDNDGWNWIWFSIIPLIVSVVVFVINVPKLINPEYFALKEILALIN